jgi:hypothetical protein
VLQEKTDPDKHEEPEGKPNWRERILSLSKLQLIVCKFCFVKLQYGSMQWRSWLRHCATNQKVAGSIPNGAIGIFH